MDRIIRLKEFLLKEPKDSFLKHALALEYVKIQNYKDAKVLFEDILKTNEDYIPSYYHLAKLLVQQNEIEKAVEIYNKGMVECKKAGDNHAYSELQSALEDLE
ncbi:MAG: tetratricopeptide repeat protein [Ferruginibacter sp.]